MPPSPLACRISFVIQCLRSCTSLRHEFNEQNFRPNPMKHVGASGWKLSLRPVSKIVNTSYGISL